jgi:hypothetical protein
VWLRCVCGHDHNPRPDLRPVIAIQRAVLHGFGDVFGADARRAAEIGDSARDFQNAVMGAGGESHAADRHFECALAGIVERADIAEVARGHARVVEAAAVLHRTRAIHADANLGGGFGGAAAAQFLERDGGDFDVDIDAVEQGPADLAEVVLDLSGRAAALASAIAVEAAPAGVQIAIGVWKRSTRHQPVGEQPSVFLR